MLAIKVQYLVLGCSIYKLGIGLATRIYLRMRIDADIRIIRHMSDIGDICG